MKKMIATLLLTSTLSLSAQNTMTYQGKSTTNATPEWSFLCESYALTGSATIQIAKENQLGLLKISVETTNPKHFIGGTVYVYLSDNTIIGCTDKGNTELNNTTITGYYNFTATELAKLKKSDIDAIRFNIKGDYSPFESPLGNFTAYNKKASFDTKTIVKKINYETAQQIAALH